MGEGRAKHPGGVVGALVNDWSLATFMTLQSGVPIAVTQANSLGYAGFTTQPPNLVGDPTLPADERTPGRWFNTAAFATANQFTIGSASRNLVRGPSYHDVDLALMRRVGVGGEREIELRLEVFNLLNTANFGRRRRSSDQPASGRHDGSRSTGRATRRKVLVLRTSYRRERLFAFVAESPGVAIITSVDLMIAIASSPRRSFRARTASEVMTAVSD